MRRDTNKALPPEVLAELLSSISIDPNNQPIPDMPPMQNEDDEHGYWDAENMGNGEGSSFQMQNDEYFAADPVGLGFDPAELIELMKAR